VVSGKNSAVEEEEGQHGVELAARWIGAGEGRDGGAGGEVGAGSVAGDEVRKSRRGLTGWSRGEDH
jgi:hypothetical protein